MAVGMDAFIQNPTTPSDDDYAEDMSEGGEEDDADERTPVAGLDEPMDEEDFANQVYLMAEDAENFVDDTIADERVRAAEYYNGEPLGDEQEGRSQIVMTEVRDTIQAMMPSLLRIFTSGQRVVDYLPRRAEDIKTAEQASDAVNFIFNEQNGGYSVLYNAFHDALLKKNGIVTWWCEETPRVIEKSLSGVTQMELAMFQQQNPNAEFFDIRAEPAIPPYEQTYSCKVRLVDMEKKYRVRALPPETFIIDRRARDTATQFDLIGYRDYLTVSQLVEMGFDEDEIIENGAPTENDTWDRDLEEQVRNPGIFYPSEASETSLKRVKYYRVFARIDKDGDGVAELRRVEMIGRGYVLTDEVVDHAPFAVFCPEPEPHTVFGHSIADNTMDLQRMKTHAVRAMFDSAAQSIYPRTVIVEGQVNIDDVLNKEIGAVIRARTAGAVQDIATPFIAQQMLPFLEYLDEVKAQRTGVTPTSQGLDADLLQSTTKAAVTAQISASQERIEVIARTFAETGMKALFSGLLKLITRHQDKPLLVRLRGEWTPVDPTTWDANMDCTVSVALGRGDDAQQMAFLTQIAQKQEMILQQIGVSNPLVKPSQYANTLQQICLKAGFKNPDQFFTPISAEQDAMLAQQAAAAAAQQKDPNELLAEVEVAKAQASTFESIQKTALDRAQMQVDADLERDKLEADIILRATDIAAKYGQPIDWPAIVALVNRPRPDLAAMTQSMIDREKIASAQVLAQIGVKGGSDPQQMPAGNMPQQPGPPQQPMQPPVNPMAQPPASLDVRSALSRPQFQ